MGEMRAISLWQPWASLIFTGHKVHETRSFRFPPKLVGQRIAIHAAKRIVSQRAMTDELHELCMDVFGCGYPYSLPRGGLLGSVTLVACRPTIECSPDTDDYVAGDWAAGRYAWELADPIEFSGPFLPSNGKQGWWTLQPKEDEHG